MQQQICSFEGPWDWSAAAILPVPVTRPVNPANISESRPGYHLLSNSPKQSPDFLVRMSNQRQNKWYLNELNGQVASGDDPAVELQPLLRACKLINIEVSGDLAKYTTRYLREIENELNKNISIPVRISKPKILVLVELNG